MGALRGAKVAVGWIRIAGVENLPVSSLSA